MKEVKKQSKIKNFLCIFGYVLIPIFFILLYFLMTETYEDIMQGNVDADKSVFAILHAVRGYIPRLGEFYQRIAVHYMTPQLSFGLDMVFRLMMALIASGTIYVSAIFILGRRLKLQYKDVLICLGIMLFMMISVFSEPFTCRFSHAHNYVLALLVTIGSLLPFRIKVDEKKWWNIILFLVIGFLFGISTEIAPIAFLLIVITVTIVMLVRKKITWKKIWKEYRLCAMVIIGVVLGLIFFNLNAGIGGRVGGAYAEKFDYVSIFEIFKCPGFVVKKLIDHFWYNIRYVFFAIPLMGTFLFVEWNIFKKERKYFWWQLVLTIYCILFVGATTVIAVHDDLYPRFMLPMFIAIVLATGLFVWRVFEYCKTADDKMKKPVIIAIICNIVMILDMAIAFGAYNVETAPRLEAIVYHPGDSLEIGEIDDDHEMYPSLIFKFRQYTPFHWGSDTYYLKFGLTQKYE